MKGAKNKRDRTAIDTIGPRASPPSKMAKNNDKEFTINDVMSKLDEMREEWKGEFDNVWGKLEEVDVLRAQVAELNKTKESFQRFEIEEKKKCILIKGLKSKATEKYESKTETKASLDEMFDFISITPNLADFHRLGPIKKDKSEETLIRVKFASIDDKNNLFARFKEMGKNTRLSTISLINDYPLFQLPEVKYLSGVAYDLRTAKKGTKTRIVPRGLGVVLQKYENGKWMTVNVSTIGKETES